MRCFPMERQTLEDLLRGDSINHALVEAGDGAGLDPGDEVAFREAEELGERSDWHARLPWQYREGGMAAVVTVTRTSDFDCEGQPLRTIHWQPHDVRPG